MEDRCVPAALTPEAAAYIGVNPGHNVEFRQANTNQGNTIAEAVTLFSQATPLTNTAVQSQAFDNGVSVIRYVDTGGSGNFGIPTRDVGRSTLALTTKGSFNDNATDNNFAMLSSGYIYIPRAGTWNFTVASDDGFDLQIGGQDIKQFNGGRGYLPTTGMAMIATPGLYKYQLIWFQGVGGASADFYANGPGQSTDTLVGDPAGALRVFQSEVLVNKTGPATVIAGNTLTYIINATSQIPTGFSNGLVSANVNPINVVVSDIVPANTTFVSLTTPAGWTASTPGVGGTGTVSATNPSFAAGGSASFTLTVRVNSSTPDGTILSNVARVLGPRFDTLAISPSGVSPTVLTTVTVIVPPPAPPPPPTVSGPLFATGADAGGGPQVNVYDGTTGVLRASFLAYSPGFTGGVRVATAQNRDGSSILVTGAGPGGGPQVNVYDGRTLTPIISFFAFTSVGGQQSGTAGFGPTAPSLFSGGIFVAAGDVNGDGFADIIVGADRGAGPQVQVIDGRTFNLISSFYAFSSGFTGGVRVAVGDVNGDGLADIIVGAGPGGGPQVNVYDGATLNLIASFYALSAGFTGGVYVAAGDVNGDRIAEIIIGAGAGGGPQVGVFNGSGALLSSFFAFAAGGSAAAATGTAGIGGLASSAGAFTGGVRVATSDPTGTGRARILTAAGPRGGPQVQAFDSGTIALVSSFFAYDPGFTGGVFVG